MDVNLVVRDHVGQVVKVLVEVIVHLVAQDHVWVDARLLAQMVATAVVVIVGK
jgi:hypothetical protein